MAQRRMLNIDLILDDHFTQDLSPEAQNMYVYLNMLADDDGIVSHLKRNLRMINKNAVCIDELVKKDYLIKYDEQTVVIIDWLRNNQIRADRYTPSYEDDCRSSLFITYDWRYSIDKSNAKVFTSYIGWIANHRKVNDQQRGQVSREELKQIAKQAHMKKNNAFTSKDQSSNHPVTNQKPSSNHPAPPVPDAVAVADTVSDTGIGIDKDIDSKYINSSSNGGMGEVSSSTATSTSTIDNNATRENGVDSEVTFDSSNSSISNYQDETEFLLDYINSQFTGKVHIESNERLTTLLADLQNEYQPQYIQQGIDELVDQVGSNYNASQVPPLFINHLAGAVRKVVTNQ